MIRGLCFLALLAATLLAMSIRELTPTALAVLVAASSIPCGALMLRLIVKLTGGERQAGVVQALDPALAIMPLIWVFVAALGALALWRPFPVGAAAFYLSNAAMLARLALIAAVWTWLARRVRAQFTPRFAALGLFFHAVALCCLSLDWSFWLGANGAAPQSLAMTLAAWQFLAGAGAALLAAPGDTRLRHAWAGALSGGIIATVYFAFITYFTAWYGDVPERTAWVRERLQSEGAWLPLLAFLSALAALTALALRQRSLGCCLALSALGLEIAWQLNSLPTLLAAAVVLLAMGLAAAFAFVVRRPAS